MNSIGRKYIFSAFLALFCAFFQGTAYGQAKAILATSASSVIKGEEFTITIRISSYAGGSSVTGQIAWDPNIYAPVSTNTTLPNSEINTNITKGTGDFLFDITGQTASTLSMGTVNLKAKTNIEGDYPVEFNTAYLDDSSSVTKTGINVSIVRPAIALSTQPSTLAVGQKFTVDISYVNTRSKKATLKSVTVEVTFDKTAFKALDGIPEWPNGSTDGQMELGELVKSAKIVENSLKNSTGKAILSLVHNGQSAQDILLSRLELEVLATTAGKKSIAITRALVDGADYVDSDINKVVSLNMTISDKVTTNTTGKEQVINGPGGSLISLPANSVLAPTAITISKKQWYEQDLEGYMIRPADEWSKLPEYATTEIIFEIGPGDLNLARPAMVVLPFANSDVPSGFTAADLKIYQWVPSIEMGSFKSAWRKMGGLYSSSARTLTVNTNKLGVFALVADKSVDESSLRLGSFSCSPNPFSPNGDGIKDSTMIRYDLSNKAARVWMAIFDVNGRKLVDFGEDTGKGDMNQQGTHIVEWDGQDNWHSIVPDGIYVIHLEATDIFGNVQKKDITVVVSRKMNK